ncbi:MAG: hypothetical protein AAGF12_29320 [Myxococcota bacterium]
MIFCTAPFVFAQALPEWGDRLTAPPARTQRLLELGQGLGRPAPLGGPATGAPALPVPSERPSEAPASDAARSRPRLADSLRVERTPTTRRPIGIAITVEGPGQAVLRSQLVSDIAYIPEFRVDDEPALHLVVRVAQPTRGTLELSVGLTDGVGAFEGRYSGSAAGLRSFFNGYLDDAVERVTGRRSAFQSQLVFARRLAPGRKLVFSVAADGSNVTPLTSEIPMATLPSIGPEGHVWFSVAEPTGVYVTRTGPNPAELRTGGTNMGAVVCGRRVFYAAIVDGNTDIYSADLDGGDVRRLTSHRAIDLSPTCAGDQVIFVSDRTGRPQLYRMDRAGRRERALPAQDWDTQTPSWCGDRVAFTAVSEGDRMHVRVLDLESGQSQRVSPRGGTHKDPAFSPDCRMVAWASPRGVEVARVDGRHRRLLLRGRAEAIDWGARSIRLSANGE